MKLKFSLLLLILFSFQNLVIIAQNSINTSGGLRWVSTGDIDISGNQITVEAIFRKSNASSVRNLVSKHTDPSTCNYLLRPNSFQMATSNGFYNCSNPIPTTQNVWYHAAATYDGTTIKYYLNGCLVNSISASGNLVNNDFLTGIGMQSNNLTAPENFSGNIDEVRIWNIARTQQEIEMNSNLLLPTSQPGLVAYYKFDNNYLNIQGNATFNGTPQGGVTFDVQPPLFIPLTIVSTQVVDATCYGYSDGSVTITAIGTGNLTYSIDGVTYSSSSTFNNLHAGTYTAHVKSEQGCDVTQSFTISEPPQIPTPVLNFPYPLCDMDSLVMSIDTLPGAICTWGGPNSFFTSSLDTIIPNASSINSGIYSAFFTLNGCNSDTLQQTITVNSNYSLSIDSTICSNNPYLLGNQQLTQSGNYSMTLQTVTGCDSTINLTLHVNPAYSFLRDTSFCEGDFFVYQGQTLNASGTYPFFLQTTLGCDSIITYNLIVYPIPPAPVLTNNSPLVCPGDLYFMTAQSVDSGTFSWWGPGNFASNLDSITFNPQIEDIGIYYSTVTVNGCESPSSQIPLSITNIYTFDDNDFPNVITVNGDGVNDILDLEAHFKTCQDYTMYIYNRWGNLIYQHSNNETPFQGITNDYKDAEDGVYAYRLVYEDGVKSGFFHLIR